MLFIDKFYQTQEHLCNAFDALLNERFRIDGNRHFLNTFAPKYIKPLQRIYDIGGGKSPYISNEKKFILHLYVTGLDIDQDELKNAPDGTYDQTICEDICKYRGHQDADIVICQALLEHVEDVELAFKGIASILKPGGRALIFVPSRNALYARLNLMISEKLKKKILKYFVPHRFTYHGFQTFYNRCTPRDFRSLAKKNNLVVEEENFYYISSYFSFFFPLYFLWRIWIIFYYFLAGEQAAETFSMALINGNTAVR